MPPRTNFRTQYRPNSRNEKGRKGVFKAFLIFVSISLFLLVVPVPQFSTVATMTSATPFSLLVTLTFTANEHKESFLRDISPLAAYVRDHEPETIAYQVMQSDKDPLQVLILERYTDKEKAFLQVHRSSAEFQAFRPKLKSMEEAGFVTIAGESYVDSVIGFGDRVVTT